MCKDGRWMCLLESMCRRIGWTFVSGQAARPSPSRAMTRVSSVSSSGFARFSTRARPFHAGLSTSTIAALLAPPPAGRNAEERFGRANRRFARRHQQILGPRVRRPPAFDPSARRREAKGPAPVGLLRGAKARAPVWAMSAPLSGPPRASKRRGHPYAFTLAPCHDGVLRPLFRRTPDRRRTRARLRDPATLSIFPLRTRSRPEFPAGEGRRLLCPVDQSAR